MLKEETLFGTVDKVKNAIELLRDLEPPEGYYLAFSGGKDSVVIKQLAIEAGVKFDAHYNNTTIDPPDLIRFIRKYHPDVEVHNPKMSFVWRLVEKGFPTRVSRWCCEEYKERGGKGRTIITGIRAEESSKRAGRKLVEFCYKDKTKKYINVIRNWTIGDVWEFIKQKALPYCKLYDMGWNRIGCLFCPMTNAKQRQIESNFYPRYKKLFKIAFKRLYEQKKQKGAKGVVDRWNDGEEMFEWWIGEYPTKEDPDQQVMFE
jgi:phosphoadenosine phosphosulfate reductase